MKNIITASLLLMVLVFSTQAFADQRPHLVDVGADKCIPCLKMAPILDALKEDFTDQFDVTFVDAWKNRQEAAKYHVRMIPTQIFYAADGQELYRHSGFISRQAILNQWQKLGYDFKDE